MIGQLEVTSLLVGFDLFESEIKLASVYGASTPISIQVFTSTNFILAANGTTLWLVSFASFFTCCFLMHGKQENDFCLVPSLAITPITYLEV